MEIIQNDDEVTVINDSGNVFFRINPGLELYQIGDIDGVSNGTFISINDRAGEAKININGVGLVIPKISTAVRNELSVTLESGTLIFNTDVKKFQGYNGTTWVNL